ncbi:MAG: hypothetical protein ACQETE_12115 [Bacteroidota bacterium]
MKWSSYAENDDPDDQMAWATYLATVNPVDAQNLLNGPLSNLSTEKKNLALSRIQAVFGNFEKAASRLDRVELFQTDTAASALLEAGRLAFQLGAYYQSEQFLQQAIMGINQDSQPLAYARWLKQWGLLLTMTERQQEGLQQLKLAKDTFREHDAQGEEIWANLSIAQAYIMSEQFEDAEALLEQTIQLADQVNDVYASIIAQLMQGDLHRLNGQNTSASTSYRRALNAANGVRTTYLESIARLRLGQLFTQLNNYETSINHLREAKALVERKGYLELNAQVEAALIALYQQFNAFKTASEHADLAEDLYQQTGRDTAIDRLALVLSKTQSGITPPSSAVSQANQADQMEDKQASESSSGVSSIWLWLALAGIIGSGYLYWIRFEDGRKHKQLTQDKNRLISQLDQMNNQLRESLKKIRAEKSSFDEQLEERQRRLRRAEDDLEEIQNNHHQWMKLLSEILPHWYEPIQKQLEDAEIKQSRGRRTQQADWLKPVTQVELLLLAISEWATSDRSVSDSMSHIDTYAVDLRTWFEDTRSMLDRLSDGLDSSLNYHFDLQAMVNTNPNQLSDAIRLLIQALMMDDTQDNEEEAQGLILSVEQGPTHGDGPKQIAVKVAAPDLNWEQEDLTHLIHPLKALQNIDAIEHDRADYWNDLKKVIQRLCLAAAEHKVERCEGTIEWTANEEGVTATILMEKAEYELSEPTSGPDLFTTVDDSEQGTEGDRNVENQTGEEAIQGEMESNEGESEIEFETDPEDLSHADSDDDMLNERSESEGGKIGETQPRSAEPIDTFEEISEVDEEEEELLNAETDAEEGDDKEENNSMDNPQLGDELQNEIKNWLSNAGSEMDKELSDDPREPVGSDRLKVEQDQEDQANVDTDQGDPDSMEEEEQERDQIDIFTEDTGEDDSVEDEDSEEENRSPSDPPF